MSVQLLLYCGIHNTYTTLQYVQLLASSLLRYPVHHDFKSALNATTLQHNCVLALVVFLFSIWLYTIGIGLDEAIHLRPVSSFIHLAVTGQSGAEGDTAFSSTRCSCCDLRFTALHYFHCLFYMLEFNITCRPGTVCTVGVDTNITQHTNVHEHTQWFRNSM